jgi:hypothetical protein
MIENELTEIQNDIENSKELEPYIIDIDMIDNQYGKVIELINNEDTFNYKLKNQYYNFKFKEAIYIKEIIFTVDNEATLGGMELVGIDILNKSTTTTFSKQHKRWLPNRVLKEFKFKAPKRMINKIILKSIKFVGYKLDDFSTIKNIADEIKEYKKDLSILTQKLESKDKELDDKIENADITIDEKNNQIEELQSTIQNLETEVLPPLEDVKISLDEDITRLSIKNESLELDKTNLTNNIKQLTEESNQLNKEISNQTNELKKLTDDTNIFATEMKEYIKQGNEDIKLYTKLSLIPWVLIAIVSGIVFFGASDLSTIYNTNIVDGENIDISNIFWSRIPFVLIVISILFVSYEISKIFIKNIIHIHKQKRIFTKIGILAKDVAEKSILSLNIDEKDKFELRTKVKMDLLKSHLKNEIGEDYEYKVKTSLLEYLPNFKKKKE